jgi:hypothetical protein
VLLHLDAQPLSTSPPVTTGVPTARSAAPPAARRAGRVPARVVEQDPEALQPVDEVGGILDAHRGAVGQRVGQRPRRTPGPSSSRTSSAGSSSGPSASGSGTAVSTAAAG